MSRGKQISQTSKEDENEHGSKECYEFLEE